MNRISFVFYILYPTSTNRCYFLIFMDFDLFAFMIFFIKWYNAQYKYIRSHCLSESQTLKYFADSTMYDLHSAECRIPYADIHFTYVFGYSVKVCIMFAVCTYMFVGNIHAVFGFHYFLLHNRMMPKVRAPQKTLTNKHNINKTHLISPSIVFIWKH